MFLNVHDDIPSLMKGRFASDGVFMEGVFEVGVFVCFILAFLRDTTPQSDTKQN